MDVRAELREIFDLVEAGRIEDAENRCRRSLEANPDEINVLGLLGAILLRKGELDEAEQYLTRTTELEPAFPKPWEDLGALWMARKQPDRAAPFFARAAELNRGAARTDPRLAHADRLRKDGDSVAAERACEEILNREPDHPGALRLLAMIATDNEQFIIAEAYLRRIVARLPANVRAMLDLARFLGDRGRYAEAIELLMHADAEVLEDPVAQGVLGDMLGLVGRSEEALRAYDRCLAKRPRDVSALLGRGHMLRIAGRRDEAADCYRRCVTLQSDFGEAWWNLAGLVGAGMSDDDIRTMQGMAGTNGISPHADVGLRFALARVFETRGDYAAAWEQYRIGNAAKRALVKYDPVETEVSQRKIRETFDAEMLAGDPAATPAGQTPIFIVGMPRSGSTLVEQILASHSQVQGVGELPYIIMITKALLSSDGDDIRYPEIVRQYDVTALTGLGRSYLHHASTHLNAGKRHFTDKMPANFQHAGFIRLVLPQAKIIDVRREPMAACVANYRQLFARGKNQSYDLTELGEYYLGYVETMAHWDEVLPGQVLKVQYEDVVADLEKQVRRLLEFCGLPYERACLDFHENRRAVNTASAEQVRQPIYDSAVDFWKNYEPYLDELREVLAPML